VFPLLFIGLMLTGEFTLLDETTEVSEVTAIAVFLADRPKFIRSERRTELRDPTQS
jgi:excinuclease UvrABC helicase subunit UvrB